MKTIFDRIAELEDKLGYHFSDRALLTRALTHSSFYKAEGRTPRDNERMEYLGDAVLELCVSDFLYHTYPDMQEGSMTRARAELVCETALFRDAEPIGLAKHILLSHGEDAMGGRSKPSIVSDAMEAVICAIYLDGGLEAARSFIAAHVTNSFAPAAVGIQQTDAKTRLQEYTQAKYEGRLPTYRLMGEEGPDHHKLFHMEVLFDDKVLGEGSGATKQQAGQDAARKALELLGINGR